MRRYNLKDLLKSPTWEPTRCQGYFVWSHFVIAGIRGTNAPLEAALDDLFSQSFVVDGVSYPALPEGDMEAFLQDYYSSMEKARD